MTTKLQGFGTTIFAEMSALAVATGAVNLGQGFPDSDGPPEVLDAAVDAIRSGVNQYPPGIGLPVLREAVARHQRRFYGLEHDPDTEVLVTAGATEALAGALLGLLEEGDEIVVFEPMYDSYQPCIALAGARTVPVLLRPDADRQYHFDPADLRAAVTPRTRLIILNTPHNPTGKVFDAEELALVAEVAIEHDLVVVTDEVYEHLVFPGATHVPIATLPGMAERTLTISSGGKTFNTTGWKIGWACGPAPLVSAASCREAVLDVRQRRTVPAGDRRRARPRRRLLRCAGRRSDGQTRPSRRRTGGRRLHDVPTGGDVLHDRRHPSHRPGRRRHGVLPCAARALRRRGRAGRGALRPSGARPSPRPLRLLQAPRRAGRGDPPPEGASP